MFQLQLLEYLLISSSPLAVLLTASISAAMEVADYVPDCAVAGVQYGAGLGAVAGGLSGAAALSGTGIR